MLDPPRAAGPLRRVPGDAPLLFVRERAGSAYRRMARDPEAFAPAMAAIFGNPALAARLRPGACRRCAAAAEAENAWVVGKELIRHGQRAAGCAAARFLRRRAVTEAAALLAAAHVLPVLPRASTAPSPPTPH